MRPQRYKKLSGLMIKYVCKFTKCGYTKSVCLPLPKWHRVCPKCYNNMKEVKHKFQTFAMERKTKVYKSKL